MSTGIVPDKEGLWWYRSHPSQNRRDKIVRVVMSEWLSGGLEFTIAGETVPVGDVNGEWLGPAMPPEGVAALQSRITQLESKCHQQQVEIADLRKELERATAGLQ